MSQYFARVELQGYPTEDQYQRLHNAMDNIGFKRMLIGNDRRTYKLPTATYYKPVSFSAVAQERDSVRTVANNISTNNLVLVIDAKDAGWYLN
jgi:hypothetical protein